MKLPKAAPAINGASLPLFAWADSQARYRLCPWQVRSIARRAGLSVAAATIIAEHIAPGVFR